MKLDDALQAHVASPDYVPARIDELAKALRLNSKADRNRLSRLVSHRIHNGTLAKIKKERICLPRDADLVGGTISFRQSGSALIITQAKNGNHSEKYDVRAEDTGTALHGDQVMARKVRNFRGRYRNQRKRRGGASQDDKQFAKVLQVVDRKNSQVIGTLKRSNYTWFVIPDDPRIVQDVLVPDPKTLRLKPKPRVGDKVVVKLYEWKERHLNPEGKIVEVLGKSHTPMAEYKAILAKYHLDPEFPTNVMDEVATLPDRVRKEDIGNRLDCRPLFCVTIDPQDAKDFDDAITFEEQPDGTRRIGVHIADVSAYVKPSTALIREAKKRGNSTYLVGTVIPMLPHKLSNGVCSLVEAKDRLTKSVFLTFDSKNQLLKTEFANTVIHSRKRLTYEQAFALLKEDDLDVIRDLPTPPAHQTGFAGRVLNSLADEELSFLQDLVRKLWDVAGTLRTRRMKRGSLDLDMTEVKIYVDEQGYADRIESVAHDESHQLIEEFMLAANEAVAKAIREADLPGVYRVHDQPDDDKLSELEETMLTHEIRTGDLSNRKHMTALLSNLKDHPQGYTLRIEVLRSLKQACYRNIPDGHYGLCKDDYTHFTSPIRRYSDLVVHQTFDRLLKRKRLPSAPAKLDARYSAERLDGLCEHISITERNSTDAERESVKIKLLEFFERQMDAEEKRPFDAVITDIKNHGMFVELTPSMAFGKVPLSSMKDDLYVLNGDGKTLIGRRKKRKFCVGDRIRVVVTHVDRFRRLMDFRLA